MTTKKRAADMIRDNKSNNDEAIAKLLGAIIYRETSKPDGECDTELVRACEEELASLDLSANVSEDELNKKLTAITDKKHGNERINRKHIIKRISTVAACFILVVGILTVTAYATVPSFSDMIRRVLHMPVGSSIDDDGITFINEGSTKQYSTLDELTEAEELNNYGIIFPTNLPDELKIVSIVYTADNDGRRINIIFSDESVMMGIEISGTIDAASTVEKTEINGFVVNIDKYEDQYVASMLYEDNAYYVTSADRNIILTIFEHMSKE